MIDIPNIQARSRPCCSQLVNSELVVLQELADNNGTIWVEDNNKLKTLFLDQLKVVATVDISGDISRYALKSYTLSTTSLADISVIKLLSRGKIAC